jgi:hypothetical protein
MKWADLDGVRTEARPGAVGKCPSCASEVIAKCGEIVCHHWAHKVKDCDPWSEPESEWHRSWKALFPPEMQEVVIGPHRADVLTAKGVIEFQRSPISSAEIKKREAFYGKMVWVVDASKFSFDAETIWRWSRWKTLEAWKPKYKVDLFSLFDLLNDNAAFPHLNPSQLAVQESVDKWFKQDRIKHPCLRWLWPRKSWQAATKTLIFDRPGAPLMVVKGINWNGEERLVHYRELSRERFVAQCMKNTL